MMIARSHRPNTTYPVHTRWLVTPNNNVDSTAKMNLFRFQKHKNAYITKGIPNSVRP